MPPHDRDQSLLDAARVFAAAVVPLKAEFALRELPESFLARLDSVIAAYERALNDQRHGRETRIEAEAAIGTTVAVGVPVVRQLYSVLRNKVWRESATLAAWASASRVQQWAGGARPGPPQAFVVAKRSEGGNENSA